MELYREFFSVIEGLNREGLAYSVVGGIGKRIRGSKQDEADIEKLEGGE